MRPIARQSTRLASSSRVRQSSRPRSYISCPKRRFSTSTPQGSDSRFPGGTPEHRTSLNERKDKSENEEQTGQERRSEVENEDVKPAAEQTRKSRIALQHARRKQVNEVPEPPPLPPWFLERNVRLLEATPGLDVGAEGEVKGVRCVDSRTGDVLFTIPYWESARPAGEGVKHLVDNRRGWADTPQEWCRVFQAGRLGRGVPGMRWEELMEVVEVETEAGRERVVAGWKDMDGLAVDKGGKEKAEKEKVKGEIVKEDDGSSVQRAHDGSRFVPGSARDLFGIEWFDDPMAWFVMEAEAGLRAALSLADSDRRSASFAADRVDLSLQCEDSNSHDHLDDIVSDLAGIVGADMIRLDANDFADLTETYVEQGNDAPKSMASLGYDVFDGFVADGLQPRPGSRRKQDDADQENDLDEDDDEGAEGHPRGSFTFASPTDVLRGILGKHGGGLQDLRDRIQAVALVPGMEEDATEARPRPRAFGSRSRSSDMNRDDSRMDALLDSLLDAGVEKRAGKGPVDSQPTIGPGYKPKPRPASRIFRMHPHIWKSQIAWLVGSLLHNTWPKNTPYRLELEYQPWEDSVSPANETRKTIVHVRDLRDIGKTAQGNYIVRRLLRLVRKRRRAGEQIVLVGTTAGASEISDVFYSDRLDDSLLRTLSVPPTFRFKDLKERMWFLKDSPSLPKEGLNSPAYRRILEINLRHMQSMLRRLCPGTEIDISSPKAHEQLHFPGMHFLTERVLTLDEVQRLCLGALGLSKSYAHSDRLHPLHIVLAAMNMIRNDHVITCWPALREKREKASVKAQSTDGPSKGQTPKESNEDRMEALKKSCNNHETKLLTGVVDAQNIKTRFEDVHAPTETIDALKTLTSLSLLRPDAFKYGVLANDRLPGLLLYGPPGTGKTLLAKAVAKESRATVLEISGAQIYEKYVGEGEKMVRAVFSLAKKLSPCVVFIDEADSIFGSRGNHANRNTHREIINQFLRQWDGMDDHGVFMMVASNRPFDLDDAVLRRLPRRVLVDLPVAKDRESILGIHLRNEDLDSAVSLTKLAEQTPLYSGSDLKNLSVAAALACVREENELSQLRKDDTEFKLPEKRTLFSRHFDKAMTEISASISEDMSSLAAIRKFDEQYGDRKGRRKKTGYGFGAVDGAVDEAAARVRQSSPPPP